MNERLADLGMTVVPQGFSDPNEDALGMVEHLTEEQALDLMAAAWIDDYLAAGGTFHLNTLGEDVLYIGSPVPTTEEQQMLLDQVKADQPLRPAVNRVVKVMMHGRRVMFMSSGKPAPLPDGRGLAA